MSKITNQILAGDCLEIMPKIQEEIVTLVITFPPYKFSFELQPVQR